MKKEEARKLLADWEVNEPNKFKAWTWFGLGLKETERFNIMNDVEVLPVPLGKAVAEFEEHWRYERQAALTELVRLGEEDGLYDEDPYFHLADSKIIGGIINTTESGEEETGED